jgi:hypothetical protein
MKTESRSLKQLIHLPAPYDFRYGPFPALLKDSIQKIGIVHAPLLKISGEGEHLIHGRQRIQAAHALNPEGQIEVTVYEENELSETEGFNLCFFENISMRSLNPMEKSKIVRILASQLKKSSDEIIKIYFPFLQFAPKPEIMDQMLRLEKLPENAKDLLASGLLQVDAALDLLEFEENDRNILLGWIKEWHLGINAQKKLIHLSWDVLKRKGIPVHKLILEVDIKTILEGNLNPSQKWARLEGVLKRLRYPQLSRMESDFQEIKKELRFPPSVSLHAPAYFEGTDYLIQFHFKNHQELEDAVAVLKRTASESEKLKTLFRLTGEDV